MNAQFLDHFDDTTLFSKGEKWTYITGDGHATIDFIKDNGYATVQVDATQDARNIWWALIKREVSQYLNLSLLEKQDHELRVETRIKVSHAPRRVNLHFNTQRTKDFHTHLMEYDIPDTTNWHTISMTTKNFDAQPGDQVNVQMALMDWGLEKYEITIDYFKVEVVNVTKAEPDKGVAVPYHPPIPDIGTLKHIIPVSQDVMIDDAFPDVNYNDWSVQEKHNTTNVLTVNGTQHILLRWNFDKYRNMQISGAGLLRLTTRNVQRHERKIKDFGMIRVIEITGGQPDWDEEKVTYHSFCNGNPLKEIINGQMIIDVEVNESHNSNTYITISEPVMKRLFSGKTRGIIIQPLGAINASFYSNENVKKSPELFINFKEDQPD